MRGPMPHPHQFPTLTLACALLLSSAATVARADSPFSCPAPRSVTRQKTETIHQPSFAAGGIIDITSDRRADLRLEDRSMTFSGHVVVTQGERLMKSDDAEYQSNDNSVRVPGKLDYEDPLIHLTGGNGRYSTSGGASFNDAQFELLQRDAHGAAKLVDLTPGGILRLQDVTFSTCPMTEEVWQIRAATLTLDSGEHTGVARDATVDFKGVPILYLPWLSFPLDDEPQDRLPLSQRRHQQPQRPGAVRALVLEHRP